MSAVVFTFDIFENVFIPCLKLKAKIFARCDRGNGLHEYRVIYWADSKRNDEWLYEYELEKCS